MKLLLKKFKANPTDIQNIFNIEKHIKNNWKLFSAERNYDYLAFSDSFSQLVMKLEDGLLTEPKEVINFFSSNYRTVFDKLNAITKKVDDVGREEIIRYSRLDFSELSPSEHLIFYKYLHDKKMNERVSKILSKIQYSAKIDDELFIKKLAESNFITMYLSSQLGSRKFMEFSELVNTLGIYYPMINIPDTEVSVKLKEGILNKFLDTIDSGKVDNLLQNFVFK